MIKHLTTSLIIVTMFSTMLPAQPVKTDWQKENLKGNVSKVEMFKKTVIEEWGEEKDVLTPLQTAYYNEHGNLVFIVYAIPNGKDYTICRSKKFSYDSSGRLVSVHIFIPESYSTFSSPVKDDSQELDEYEYDSSGRLRSISYFNTQNGKHSMEFLYDLAEYRPYQYDNRADTHIAKEIWTYTSDGFKHAYCDNQGKTRKKEIVSENGKVLEDDWGRSIFDNDGRILARGGTIVAGNGSATYGQYYGYNKNGDLVIESSKAIGQKEIDSMPWLSATYNSHNDIYYEYTYDSSNNWIERKKYRTQNGNRPAILEEDIVRKIEYGVFSFNPANMKPKPRCLKSKPDQMS